MAWYDISGKTICTIVFIYIIFLVLIQVKLSMNRKEHFQAEEEKVKEEKPKEDKANDKKDKSVEKVDDKKDKSVEKKVSDDTSSSSTETSSNSERKSLWQVSKESKLSDDDSDSTISKLNIKKVKRPNTLDQKEIEYEENLKKQDELIANIKKLEKQRSQEFIKEYFESAKVDKEIGDLKNKIKSLEEDLKQCAKRKENKKEESNDRDKKSIVVGCKSDRDCNLFYGEGKNVCKSDNKCRCEVGSGELCQYGPTNYKDPKDMTKKERDIFKHMSNYDNFTIQDYKNWLMLYTKDYYMLSDEHLINLRKIMRGEPIRLRDIPTSSIYPPDTSQKYFAQMYDKITNSEAIVAPINSATTGIQIGYNYNDYSEFSPPESLVSLKVVNGEIERKYRRPSEKNKIFPVPLEDAIGPYQKLPNM